MLVSFAGGFVKLLITRYFQLVNAAPGVLLIVGEGAAHWWRALGMTATLGFEASHLKILRLMRQIVTYHLSAVAMLFPCKCCF